jgi:hypothetical protein
MREQTFHFYAVEVDCKWQEVAIAGLEVEMVGSGGSATCSIVEYSVASEFLGETEHVDHGAFYSLWYMPIARYCEMSRENRKRIYEDCIVVVPFDAALYGRPVFGA